jgi:hypothetical protein
MGQQKYEIVLFLYFYWALSVILSTPPHKAGQNRKNGNTGII